MKYKCFSDIPELKGVKELEIITRVSRGSTTLKSIKHGCYADAGVLDTDIVDVGIHKFIQDNIPANDILMCTITYDILCLYRDGDMKVITIYHKRSENIGLTEYQCHVVASVSKPKTNRYRKLYNMSNMHNGRYNVNISDFRLFIRHFTSELKDINEDKSNDII